MFTPDRAFSIVVVPLSLLMIVGGALLAFLFAFTSVPITSPVPFVRSSVANRAIFSCLAVVAAAIGIALLSRRRIAWHALLSFFVLGVLLPLLGLADDRAADSTAVPPDIFYVLAAMLNGAIGAAICYVAWPAFRRSSPRQQPYPADAGERRLSPEGEVAADLVAAS